MSRSPVQVRSLALLKTPHTTLKGRCWGVLRFRGAGGEKPSKNRRRPFFVGENSPRDCYHPSACRGIGSSPAGTSGEAVRIERKTG